MNTQPAPIQAPDAVSAIAAARTLAPTLRDRAAETDALRRLPYGSTALDTNTTVSPFDQQYLSSLYWSLTTLMKTPWLGPDTVAEKVYASFCVVFGAVLFATLLANVTAMVSSYDPPAELTEWLKAGPPPVFIGFGSMMINDAGADLRLG